MAEASKNSGAEATGSEAAQPELSDGEVAMNRYVNICNFGNLSDDLVCMILARTEPVPPGSGHVDLNTLAVLAEGSGGAEGLEEVWAHIAACPPCRRLVGATLIDAARAEDDPAQAPARRAGDLDLGDDAVADDREAGTSTSADRGPGRG